MTDQQLAQTVTIATAGGGMATYDATPDGAAAQVGKGHAQQPRGVVVIQEAFGVTAHIEEVARRFAAAGYRALAPHLFHRTGDPALSYDSMEEMWPHLKVMRGDQVLDDLDACFGYLEDTAGLSLDQIGIVGFCMGGSVTAMAAAKRPLGAAASFYGGGVTEGRFGMAPLVEMAPSFQTPWLGLYGGKDEGIPIDQAEALGDAAKQSSVPTEMVIYPEAGHGFHCNDRPKSYHEESAKDAWNRTLDWFNTHIN